MGFIQSLLAFGNFGHYHKPLMRLIGLEETIILGELCTEYTLWEEQGKLTDDNMFYCSIAKLEYETSIKEKKQRAVIKHLETLGILETKLKGVPATRYIKIDESVIQDLYNNPDQLKCQNCQISKNNESSSVNFTDLDQLKCRSSNIINNKNIIYKNNNKFINKFITETELVLSNNNSNLSKEKNEIKSKGNDLGESDLAESKNFTNNSKEQKEICLGNQVNNRDNETRASLKPLPQKPGKVTKNLYTKCMDLLDAYVQDNGNNEELRENLKLYLLYRLEIRDKPLYTNMWKGMLKKLDSLATDEKDKINIVVQSLNRGYLSFYEVSTYKSIPQNKKPHNSGVKCVTYSNEELEQIKQMDEDRMKEGRKTKF